MQKIDRKYVRLIHTSTREREDLIYYYDGIREARAVLASLKFNLKKFSPWASTFSNADASLWLNRLRKFRREIKADRGALKLVYQRRGIQVETAFYLPTGSNVVKQRNDFNEGLNSLTYSVQSHRRQRKTRRSVVRDVLGSNVRLIGGVHEAPGLFVSLVKDVKKRRVTASKSPKTTVRHVGIELEFIAPHDKSELVDAFADANLEKFVQLKSDASVMPDNGGDCQCNAGGSNCSECCSCCSCGEEACDSCSGSPQSDDCECSCGCNCECNSGEFGHELCVLATESEYKTVIKNVCAVLKKHGAYVNKTCGLHVHLDMRTRESKQAYRNFYLVQKALFKLVPQSRRDNKFCKEQTAAELGDGNGDRYCAINSQSLNKYGTIEIRLHSGSVNARKITAWVDLLVRVASGRIESEASTVGEINKRVKLPKKLRAFLIERQRKFKNVAATDAA